MTTAEALEANGFSWQRLEALAAAALHKAMRESRTVLVSPDVKQDALEFFVDLAAAKARDYDRGLANGLSFPSYLFRTMCPTLRPGAKLFDFLRKKRGDARRGNPIDEVATDPTTLPLGVTVDDTDSLDGEIEALASLLPARAAWTLRRIGRPLAEGFELAHAAEHAGVTLDEAEELLEELGWRLGRKAAATRDVDVDDFTLMEAWVA